VDESLPPVRLPGSVLNEMFAHARQACPDECCGLLTGDDGERFRHCHRCRNEMTRLHQNDPERHPRDARHAFHMNPSDTLRVMNEAELRGERVHGVYHSHIGVEAYFSELDQEYALQELFPFPDCEHIVISLVDGEVKGTGAFRWRRDEHRFEGRRVEAEAP
jgi:proteasome lid subunit RPN8/RPN11